MRTCIYPGSFDPFTMGHLDILLRASKIFDHIIIGILRNESKTPFFSEQQRIDFIENAAKEAGISNIDVQCFDGLLIDFVSAQNANVILRGLRAVTDFEFELSIAAMNKKLAPEIETMFLMTNAKYSFLSSSIVKEVARFSGSIEGLVPECNRKQIADMLRK